MTDNDNWRWMKGDNLGNAQFHSLFENKENKLLEIIDKI